MKRYTAQSGFRLLVLLVFALPMVAIAATAYVVGGIRAGNNELRSTGVEVTATVVHRSGLMRLELEYEVGGVRRRGEAACGPDNCTAYDIGDQVGIRIDPNNPERAVLAKNPYSGRGMAIAWTILGISVVGTVAAAYVLFVAKGSRPEAAAVNRSAAKADIRRNLTFLTGFLGLVLILAGVVTLLAGGNVIASGITLASAGILLAVFVARLSVAVYRRLRTRT